MVNRARPQRVRYPAHAVLGVAAAVLLFAVDLVVGFLFMALVPPMIPVYITVLFACGCLVRSAVDYAVRVSVPEAAAMLQPRHDQETGPRAASAARA